MKEKNIIVITILTLFFNTSLIAQTVDNKLAFGISGVSSDIFGDYGNGFLKIDRIYPAIGISLGMYVSPSIDLGIQGSFGRYGMFETIEERFFGNKFDMSLYGHYKFNNGYILGKYNKLSPFATFGIGVATYSRATTYDYGPNPTIIAGGPDLIIPLGAGLKYQLSAGTAIQYQYIYNFTSQDIRDESRGPSNNKRGNDAFGEHIVSLIFSLRKPIGKNCYCH